MTKSPKRARGSSRKPRPAANAPAPGPVTLAEARRLARTAPPAGPARVAAAAPAVAGAAPSGAGAGARTASPEPIGKARERVRARRQEVLAQRERNYAATMDVMKARGARGPARAMAAAGGFAPLQVFAEGDSWFDYPAFPFKGGIIGRLETRLGVPILNLASAGDEVRYMLGVEQRERLIRHLREGCPAGGPWDALLFSGGGNDVVGDPMALWIRDWDPARPPADHVDAARFDAILAVVRAGYEDLIALRDSLSPTTHLMFHAYDFAIPDGRGICGLGPWLKPTFDLRGFPDQASRAATVRAMLTTFAAALAKLANRPGVTFLNTQGTLPPGVGSWHNELHPDSEGFDRVADLFHAKLREIFPGRVL